MPPADAAQDAPGAGLSAACLLAVALLTVAHMFSPARELVWALGAAAGLFLAREYRRVPRGILRISLALGLLSAALLAFSPTPAESLARGIAIGGLLTSLVGAVSLLARAALRSDRSRVVAAYLLAQGSRRRYAGFTLACQLFGGLLGLAGVSMLMDMAARDDTAAVEERLSLFLAITRSFAAATLWSPMFSNVSILLVLYPGLDWFAVVPLSLGLAGAVVAIGLGLDLWRQRGQPARPGRAPGGEPLARSLLPMLAAMGGFLGLVLALARSLHIAVAGAIVLLTPLAALGLNLLQAPSGRRRQHALADLRADYFKLPTLAGETMLFMAAGCGGTVIASAIPPAWTAVVGGLIAGNPVLACLALMSTVVLLAFLAVHPVLSAVLIASCFPPALLGLPMLPHLAAILVGWAVAGAVTPFSMVALMASRYSGFSIYAISVRANHWFAVLCMGSAALALGGLAALGHAAH